MANNSEAEARVGRSPSTDPLPAAAAAGPGPDPDLAADEAPRLSDDGSSPAGPVEQVTEQPQPQAADRAGRPEGMIPTRPRGRTKLERGSMRVLATGGIVGIATALGAILVGNNVAGWIVGLAVGITSVVLAAVLWSSRQL